MGSDHVNLDKYLLDIARDRRYWENKRAEIRRKEKAIDETLARYSDDAEKLRQQRREIIGEAREEAKRDSRRLERSHRAYNSRHSQRPGRQGSDQRSSSQNSRKNAKLAQKTRDSHPLLDKAKKKRQDNKPKPADSDRPLQAGDTVVLDGGNTVGTIDSISGKKRCGSFRANQDYRQAVAPQRTLRKGIRTEDRCVVHHLADIRGITRATAQLQPRNRCSRHACRRGRAGCDVLYRRCGAVQLVARANTPRLQEPALYANTYETILQL